MVIAPGIDELEFARFMKVPFRIASGEEEAEVHHAEDEDEHQHRDERELDHRLALLHSVSPAAPVPYEVVADRLALKVLLLGIVRVAITSWLKLIESPLVLSVRGW